MTENPESQKFETGKLKLKITLAADRNAVDPVVQSVMELVREVHCDPEKYDAIELALTEALANAVVHGAKADPSKIVECDVVCNEDKSMLIVVRDPGTGFDPGAVPEGNGHYGISGMRERVERLGGAFRMESSPGHGARLEVVLP